MPKCHHFVSVCYFALTVQPKAYLSSQFLALRLRFSETWLKFTAHISSLLFVLVFCSLETYLKFTAHISSLLFVLSFLLSRNFVVVCSTYFVAFAYFIFSVFGSLVKPQV